MCQVYQYLAHTLYEFASDFVFMLQFFAFSYLKKSIPLITRLLNLITKRERKVSHHSSTFQNGPKNKLPFGPLGFFSDVRNGTKSISLKGCSSALVELVMVEI